MAHEIDTMAYTGETPWHGLGSHLPDGGTIDEWRIAAGMEWEIKRSAVMFLSGKNKYDGMNVLYRSDNERPLGIVSDKYRPVQPREVLEFYRTLVGDDGQFTLETAGVLKHGQKLWALARRNEQMKVGKDDVLLPYLLLATSCDGSLATTAKFTTVRVVCNNTLQMSLGGANEIKVPHHTTFDIKAVHARLGLIDEEFGKFIERATNLAKAKVNDREAAAYFTRVIGTKDQLEAFQKDGVTSKTVTQMLELFKQAPGSQLTTADGTVWGLVNAVTRFYDHERFSRDDTNDSRLNSAWFGKGNAVKDRAVSLALKMAA